MTCIIGIVSDDRIYIGADSLGCEPKYKQVRLDPKVFRNGPALIAYTSSFRMGQILEHKFKIPKRKKSERIMSYMCGSFVDELTKTLKEFGYGKTENGVESAGNFLVAIDGDLFSIESDYQVARCLEEYMADGSGQPYALGSLYSSSGKSPKERIKMALASAGHFCPTVGGPFVVKSIKRNLTNKKD